MRVGRFEAANSGTLFLDEIGNLSLSGQMKLLRVLQSGEFERLGSHTTRHANVRLISATNADLLQGIADKTFREDLYFRLNLIELRVPPLAERPEDILPLAEHFLAQSADDGSPKRSRPKREHGSCATRGRAMCGIGQSHPASPSSSPAETPSSRAISGSQPRHRRWCRPE